MTTIPRNSPVTSGADLTGTDGTANRTYVIVDTEIISAGIAIIVNGTPLMEGASNDFTYTDSTETLTFLNIIDDTDVVSITYFATISSLPAIEGALYVTVTEMRTFMQLAENDYPSNADIESFIYLAQSKITLDISTDSPSILRLSAFLLTKYYILRALATKSVAKGYVMITAEGRQITKSYQELVLEAENTFQEYKTFIVNNNRSEVTSTNFMSNSTIVSPSTRRAFVDNWTGTQNALDYDGSSKIIYARRNRR